MSFAIKGTIKSRLDAEETRFIVAYRLVILREISLLRGECVELVTRAATSTRATKARVVTRGQLTGNVSLNDKSNVDCCAAAECRGTMRFQFYYASCGR
ncbi:Uncharacterized protein DBV15_09186 [Temnothorax longispinosus]|uniref:Uncharacterized protein n=1 Tax=Temnothorax longispinosus TaxID=300112 RepID=A0A4S2KNQ4_9HYME|nr:Uncharacterized protein DBV15_09186 [Temnothorax longispinosus]